MSNPFKNFVPDPSKIPDPKTISMSQFEKYHSHEMDKMAQNIRVLKRSSKYIGGCLGFIFVLKMIIDSGAKNYLFGTDMQGGRYLDLTTPFDEHHYAYNREFQRMFVLGETKLPDTGVTSKQLLVDLGVDVKVHGASDIPKKAPHEKYY